MKKVVFLSWHYYNSQRQAGFHFLANAFRDKGFHTVFISSAISLLTFLRKDAKIYEKNFTKNVIKPMNFNGVESIINTSLFQPAVSRDSKILELLAKFFFRLTNASQKEIRTANYVVFESLSSIMFFDKVKLINPEAKIIYRMSDDIEVLKAPKVTVEYERSILSKFDLVSVPTKVMYDKFLALSPDNVKLHFHGIDKEIYNEVKKSPYTEKINHIFVGNSHLDEEFINIASSLFQDHYFHIIGTFEQNIKKENVIYYGYTPFIETIPYVKFATTGLQIRSNDDGVAETLSDSLKVLQYSYCKLPTIAPSVIPAYHRENFFYYEYNDEDSIRECIEKALTFDKSKFIANVKSWDELAIELIND
jgi:2-beta-glucuronyltransferase